MGETSPAASNITMGSMVLYHNNTRHIGYLEDVEFNYKGETEDVYIGCPAMLVTTFPKKIESGMKAQFYEMTASNIAMVLGGLPITAATIDGYTGQQVNMGAQFLFEERALKGIHIDPDTGKRHIIQFHKCRVDGNFTGKYSNKSPMISDVTFKSLRDESQTANPLGLYFIED